VLNVVLTGHLIGVGPYPFYGWLDVAAFHIWHLERHRTTTTIRHPELLPNDQELVEAVCLANVGTGWSGEAPPTRFAIHLRIMKLSWANYDCTIGCVYLPMLLV